MAVRISTPSSRPCSSRCLIVCVRETPSGTRKAGRPRRPVLTAKAVGSRDRLGVGSPAVAAPTHRLPLRTSMGLRDRLGCQGLLASSAGVSDGEATLAVLDHQAPTLAPSRRILRCEVALLLRTNDQNSSTSSVEGSRSWTNTSVSASACSAASLSQRPIVSYLWPVISSAALRLPRRITTRSARPTSSGGVRSRYIGVLWVSPNQAPQALQW